MVSLINSDFALSFFQGLHLRNLVGLLLFAEAWRNRHGRNLLRLLWEGWFRQIEHVGTTWPFMSVWEKMVGNLKWPTRVETASHWLIEALNGWLEWFVIQVMEHVFISLLRRALFAVDTHWKRGLGHGNSFLTLGRVHEARRFMLNWIMVQMVCLVRILMIRIDSLDHMTRVPMLIHKLLLKLLWTWAVWSWPCLTRSKRTYLSRSWSTAGAKIAIRHFSILSVCFI